MCHLDYFFFLEKWIVGRVPPAGALSLQRPQGQGRQWDPLFKITNLAKISFAEATRFHVVCKLKYYFMHKSKLDVKHLGFLFPFLLCFIFERSYSCICLCKSLDTLLFSGQHLKTLLKKREDLWFDVIFLVWLFKTVSIFYLGI